MNVMIKNSRGFTIIEALVAASIFTFGFTATNTSQVNMIKAQQNSMQTGFSSLLINNTIEQARAYASISAYNNLSNANITSNTPNATITDIISYSTNTNYKQMSQNTGWTDANNTNNNMSFTTFISEIDPKQSGLLLSLSQNSTGGLPSPNTGTTNNGTTSDSENTSPTNSTSVTIPGTTNLLIYILNVLSTINGQPATTISGRISLATGNTSPPNSVQINNINLLMQSNNSQVINCFYQTHTGGYHCILAKGWSGYIYLQGISNAKVCTKIQQPYENVRQAISNADYQIIRSNKDCTGQYPYLLQSL